MIGAARETATALELETAPELETAADLDLVTFPNDWSYDELVLVRDIPFEASRDLDGLAYHGVAHVAYAPADRVVGASELARLVERVAAHASTQEQLTVRVASVLSTAVSARGAGVIVEAERWTLRSGVGGVRTVTTALTGCLRDDRAARAEFLASAREPSRVAVSRSGSA
ncbi:MAG TPA: GTP cyclohydrolase I [Acidimicrobiia bacterium]|jgi:GTP cyclohydrolase I